MVKKTTSASEKKHKQKAKVIKRKPVVKKTQPKKAAAEKKSLKKEKLVAEISEKALLKTSIKSAVKPSEKIIDKEHSQKVKFKKVEPKEVEPKKVQVEKVEVKIEAKIEPPKEVVKEEVKLSEPLPVVPQEAPKPKILEFDIPITVKDLAIKLRLRANELIMNLMNKNMLVTINQNLGEDLVVGILKEYGFEYSKPVKEEEKTLHREHKEAEDKQSAAHVVTRSPVVTFMGHVDHGKTSLLDFIRKTHVADKERGGITQHIGAYEVKFKNGSVTFLDTPGHEAFTAMRARGANATDVVVLVVAADDGVMPQTKEALDHARAAGVTIVVALNKCDLPGANIDKVKGQLSQLGLTPEDWGGKTITVPVSAKTGDGVDRLLEMLLLESELLELKANPHLKARGVVIEGKLSSGQGAVATVLVKNGTLKLGDMVVSGPYYGRVKAMMDDKLARIMEAGPSKPVSILGLSGVPTAGDEFFVVKDEKKARIVSTLKQDEDRARRLKLSKRITLEDFYKNMQEGGVKELAVVVKGDVKGSVEALEASLLDLSTKDVKVNIIHSDVGNVNESDVMLSVVSNAVVIGFNVKVDEKSGEIAAKEGIEIKLYGIIYEAIEDVRAAMEGLLEPVSKEIFIGRAQVKQVFNVTRAGVIAGCMVLKGKMIRNGIAKLIRGKEVVYEGKIASLKRFKDDAREVAEGFECGIALDRHNDIRSGDLIEIYQIEKVARRLESKGR